jgi:hypothetical protein
MVSSIKPKRCIGLLAGITFATWVYRWLRWAAAGVFRFVAGRTTSDDVLGFPGTHPMSS